MAKHKSRYETSIRHHLIVSGVAGLILVGGLGGWAATTELDGAVIAPGLLVAETNVKRVQHPTGGVVAALDVSEGDVVAVGQPLIQLDSTTITANLEIVVKALQQLEARQARLEAERDDEDHVVFSASILSLASDPIIAELMSDEEKLFELRRVEREGNKAQLAERRVQLNEEIEGLNAQIAATGREVELLQQDLVGLTALLNNNLIASQRVSDLERSVARAEGEDGRLVAAVARTRGQLAEVELQILQVDQNFRSQVASELSDVQARIGEFAERRIAGEDELNKTTIRAPQAGQVHQLTVHTVGGVVAPAEVVMQIVPTADVLFIEVQVAPQDIDQVSVGQAVMVRFSAFNQRTTPELQGKVQRVSPDITVDQRTGAGHYIARIALLDGQLERLDGMALSSGMPVEGFILTGSRTALSYLTKPLADQMARSFRSD